MAGSLHPLRYRRVEVVEERSDPAVDLQRFLKLDVDPEMERACTTLMAMIDPFEAVREVAFSRRPNEGLLAIGNLLATTHIHCQGCLKNPALLPRFRTLLQRRLRECVVAFASSHTAVIAESYEPDLARQIHSMMATIQDLAQRQVL